jgi:hypothetical protein
MDLEDRRSSARECSTSGREQEKISNVDIRRLFTRKIHPFPGQRRLLARSSSSCRPGQDGPPSSLAQCSKSPSHSISRVHFEVHCKKVDKRGWQSSALQTGYCKKQKTSSCPATVMQPMSDACALRHRPNLHQASAGPWKHEKSSQVVCSRGLDTCCPGSGLSGAASSVSSRSCHTSIAVLRQLYNTLSSHQTSADRSHHTFEQPTRAHSIQGCSNIATGKFAALIGPGSRVGHNTGASVESLRSEGSSASRHSCCSVQFGHPESLVQRLDTPSSLTGSSSATTTATAARPGSAQSSFRGLQADSLESPTAYTSDSENGAKEREEHVGEKAYWPAKEPPLKLRLEQWGLPTSITEVSQTDNRHDACNLLLFVHDRIHVFL